MGLVAETSPMIDYVAQNAGQILDGLLFGLGVLAVYLGAVFTGALVRSLAGAGTKGLTFLGSYLTGWFDYLRGDDRNTINVTLNAIVDGRLEFDTMVADRRIVEVWPNTYRVQMIRAAARRTTVENPVLRFPDPPRVPKRRGVAGKVRDVVHGALTSARVIENGQEQKIRLEKENDYRAAYGPLIALVSEAASNDNAIDLALGRRMEEYRFVVALTFEKLGPRRARHLRALVMWEEALKNLPEHCPRVEFPEHKTRFRTLQAIARQYRAHPERFGIVKFWRPKETALDVARVVPGLAKAAE